MGEHLVFFDAECPLCSRAVHHLVAIDEGKILLFAPLGGKTAETILSGPQKKYRFANSLVLAENYQSTERDFWIRSKAVFRIYWLLGGRWTLLGFLSFFPCWIADCFYRGVARHRHQFKFSMERNSVPKERLLP